MTPRSTSDNENHTAASQYTNPNSTTLHRYNRHSCPSLPISPIDLDHTYFSTAHEQETRTTATTHIYPYSRELTVLTQNHHISIYYLLLTSYPKSPASAGLQLSLTFQLSTSSSETLRPCSGWILPHGQRSMVSGRYVREDNGDDC